MKHTKTDPPPVMLAHSFDPDVDGKNVSIAGWYSSEKYDGIRALWFPRAQGKKSQLLTRNGTVLPTPPDFHSEMYRVFKDAKLVDGELFAGRGKFQQIMSSVMQHKGPCRWQRGVGTLKVKFLPFDAVPKGKEKSPFKERMQYLEERTDDIKACEYLDPVEYKVLPDSQAKAIQTVKERLSEVISPKNRKRTPGEGLMLRDPNSLFENGRSRSLLKVKKYDETESLVIACRSGTGKYQKMVGALYCVFNDGTLCEVGSGLSDVQRVVKEAELTIVAKVITVRHHGLTDAGIPRFPTFVCVRNDRDPWEVMNSVKRLADEGEAKAVKAWSEIMKYMKEWKVTRKMTPAMKATAKEKTKQDKKEKVERRAKEAARAKKEKAKEERRAKKEKEKRAKEKAARAKKEKAKREKGKGGKKVAKKATLRRR